MSSVVLLAFLVPLGLLARSLAEGRALDTAREDAQRVAVFAGEDGSPARLEAEVIAVNEGPMSTTVFLPDGDVLGPSADRSDAVELAALGRAVTARLDGGVELLLPVAGEEGTAVVRTFVPDDELTAGVQQTWLVLTGVGLLLLGATAVAGDRIARRLSRSALDLSHVADRLGAGDLTARVTPSGPPEIASVGRVLNGLGARVAALLATERELVADLSHRLRTPITALRLDVDLLEDATERERLEAHVDELVRAVDDVVWAARHPGEGVPAVGCDAVAVVADRVRFWGVLAADQGRPLAIEIPDGQLTVTATAAELGAAVDVLVDNVFSHTPDGTAFSILLREAGDRVVLAVHDAGPGFATTALAERGRSGAGSTGLGLDVARRTAEAAGGRLVLGASAEGGARIVLELPRG
jgi:signal transduction histidine kinase